MKKQTKRKYKRRMTFVSGSDREVRHEATLVRTKRLLLAALRVWELKHGIREKAALRPDDYFMGDQELN